MKLSNPLRKPTWVYMFIAFWFLLVSIIVVSLEMYIKYKYLLIVVLYISTGAWIAKTVNCKKYILLWLPIFLFGDYK